MAETVGDKCVVCGEADEGKPLYKKLGSGEYNVEVIVALRDLQLTSLPESAKTDHYICWDCDETILQEYGRYLEYEEKAKAQDEKIKEEKRIKRNEQRRKRRHERNKDVKEKDKKRTVTRSVHVPQNDTSNCSKAKQPPDVQKVNNDIQHSTYCLMCDSTFDSANGGYYRYSLKKIVNDDMDVASVMEFLGLARRIAPEMKTKRFICNNCFYTIRRNYKDKLLKGTSIDSPSVGKVNSKKTAIHRATPDEHAAEIAKLLPPALAECYKIMTSDSVGNVPGDNLGERQNDDEAHSNTVGSTKNHGANAEREGEDLDVSQDEHGNYVVDMKVKSSKLQRGTQNDNSDSPEKSPLPSRKKKNVLLPKRHHHHLMGDDKGSDHLSNPGLISEGENKSKGGSDGKDDDANKFDQAADSRTCNICGRSYAGKEDSWWHNLSSPLTGFDGISISMALQLLETSLANTTEKARLASQVCYPCYGMVSTGFRIQVVERIAQQKKIDSSKVNLSKVKVRMVRKEELGGMDAKSAEGKSKPKNDLGGEGINLRTKDGRKKGLKRKHGEEEEEMGPKKQKKEVGRSNTVMESPYDPNHVRLAPNNKTKNNKIPVGGVESSSESDDFSTDEDDFVTSDSSEEAEATDPNYDLSSETEEEDVKFGKKAFTKKVHSTVCKSKTRPSNTIKGTETVKSPHQLHGLGIKSVSPHAIVGDPGQPPSIEKMIVSPCGKSPLPPNVKKGVVSPCGKDVVSIPPLSIKKGVVSPFGKDSLPVPPTNINKGNSFVNSVNRGKKITSDRNRKDIQNDVNVKEVIVNKGKSHYVDDNVEVKREDISPYDEPPVCYNVNANCHYYFALSKMREARLVLRDLKDILPKEAFDGRSLKVRALPGSSLYQISNATKDFQSSALQYLLNSMLPSNWPSNVSPKNTDPGKKVCERPFNGVCVVCAGHFHKPPKFWHNLREDVSPPSLRVPVRWVLASLNISPVRLSAHDREEGRVCEPCFDKLTKQFNDFVKMKIGESCKMKADDVNISEYIVTFNQETMNIEADPVDLTPEEEMDDAEKILQKILPVIKSFNMDNLLEESYIYPLKKKEYTVWLLLVLNEFRVQLGATIEHLVGWLTQLMPVEHHIKDLRPSGKKLMELINDVSLGCESITTGFFDDYNIPLPQKVFVSKSNPSESCGMTTQHMEIKKELTEEEEEEEEESLQNMEQGLQWEDFLNPVSVDDLFAGKGRPLDRKDFNNGLLYALWKITTTMGLNEKILASWLRQISPIPLAESHIMLLLSAPKPIHEHLQQHPEDLSKLKCVIIPESSMPTASNEKSPVSQSESIGTESSKLQGSKAKTLNTGVHKAANPGSKVGLMNPSSEGRKLGNVSEREEHVTSGKRKQASNTKFVKEQDPKKHKSDISFSKSSPSSDALKEKPVNISQCKRNEVRDFKLGVTGQKGNVGMPTEPKQNRQTSALQNPILQTPTGPKKLKQTAVLLKGGGQTAAGREKSLHSPVGQTHATKNVSRQVSKIVTVKAVSPMKFSPDTGKSTQGSMPISSVSSQELTSMPGRSPNKKSSPCNRKGNSVSVCKSKAVVQTSQENSKKINIGDSNRTANTKGSIKDKKDDIVHSDTLCQSSVEQLHTVQRKNKELVVINNKLVVVTTTSKSEKSNEANDKRESSFIKTNANSVSKEVIPCKNSSSEVLLSKSTKQKVLSKNIVNKLTEEKRVGRLLSVKGRDKRTKLSELRNVSDNKLVVRKHSKGSKVTYVPQKSILQLQQKIGKKRKYKGGKHVKGRRKVFESRKMRGKSNEKVYKKRVFKRRQEKIKRKTDLVKEKEPGEIMNDLSKKLETVKGKDPGVERSDVLSSEQETINDKDPHEKKLTMVGKENEKECANVNKSTDLIEEGINSDIPNAVRDTYMESKGSGKVLHIPEQQTSQKSSPSESESTVLVESCVKGGQSSQESELVIKNKPPSVLEMSEESTTFALGVGTEIEKEDLSLSEKKEVTKCVLSSKVELEEKNNSSALSVSREGEDLTSETVTKYKELHSSSEAGASCSSSLLELNAEKSTSTPISVNVDDKCTSESDDKSNSNIYDEEGSSSSSLDKVDNEISTSLRTTVKENTSLDLQVKEETSSSSADSITEDSVFVNANSKMESEDKGLSLNLEVEKEGCGPEKRAQVKESSDLKIEVGKSVQSCDSTKKEIRPGTKKQAETSDITKKELRSGTKEAETSDITKKELRSVTKKAENSNITKKQLRSGTDKEAESSNITNKTLRYSKKQDAKVKSGPVCQNLKDGNKNNSVSKPKTNVNNEVDVNIKKKDTDDVSKSTEARKGSPLCGTKAETVSDAASCLRSCKAKGNSKNIGKVKTKVRPRFEDLMTYDI